MVRRLLPSASRQAVGPFVFFDHFGPVTNQPGDNHDVRPHPHIGLSTVTYLFQGAMIHRDSTGVVQRIEPGAINWMTAGKGIVHSERTPEGSAWHQLRVAWPAAVVCAARGARGMRTRFRAHARRAPFQKLLAKASPPEFLIGGIVRSPIARQANGTDSLRRIPLVARIGLASACKWVRASDLRAERHAPHRRRSTRTFCIGCPQRRRVIDHRAQRCAARVDWRPATGASAHGLELRLVESSAD